MGFFTQFLASDWQVKSQNLENFHVVGLKIGLLPLIQFPEAQSCDHVQQQRRVGSVIAAQKEMDLGQMKSSSISLTLLCINSTIIWVHNVPHSSCVEHLVPKWVALPWKGDELPVGRA